MADNEVAAPISLREFLESHPPGSAVLVDAKAQEGQASTYMLKVPLPKLLMHCVGETCAGPRIFVSETEWKAHRDQGDLQFVIYRCRNCNLVSKTFALYTDFGQPGQNVRMQKLGEKPAFGPPTPAKVITLLGAERDHFLKGRRAESQALGIAAFAYYRRVVENKKAAIFDEIIRVSERLGAEPEVIADLKRAKQETQFTKAVDAVKHGIPQALLINGHNPLTLLHAALSEGLHAQTDEQCLELAASIRVVLTDLVERVSSAMKEEKELTDAVTRLLEIKRGKPAASA